MLAAFRETCWHKNLCVTRNDFTANRNLDNASLISNYEAWGDKTLIVFKVEKKYLPVIADVKFDTFVQLIGVNKFNHTKVSRRHVDHRKRAFNFKKPSTSK